MSGVPQIYRAAWVLPIAGAPIRNGWVKVQSGRISAVGRGDVPMGAATIDVDGAILPGLVNAHTHLELSYLHERIPPAPRFGAWVREVMKTRRHYPDPSDVRIVEPARQAIVDARAAGTALFGDVSNTLVTVPLLRERGIAAHVFHELTGFAEQEPALRVLEARARADAAAGGDVRVSVAPHAPYSVSAGLFEAIRADLDARPGTISSVHLGETPDEVELLHTGGGEIRGVLEELGRWPGDWSPPRLGPVAYLESLGLLDARVLAVHGVQFDAADLRRLRRHDVTIVSCPRSNVYVGVGSPPLERFYSSGVGVAFGTDSLASVGDLNLFSELREARRIAPGVSAARLLESATLTGARALRFDAEFGTLEPGKRAGLVAVDVPAHVADVEEYLVSGIEPHAVRWISAR